jgi:alkylated DNA nucleotide flippase Atl1/3-methyladenine DNA glycosylase AlkD
MSRMPPPAVSNYDKIYAVIARISPGRVATYGQVAAVAGLGGHARQVGYALHALPDDSDLPWQRVINAKGEVSLRSDAGGMGGREGYQRHLLEEEGVVFDLRGRVDLKRFGWDPDEKPARRRRSASSDLREIEALLRPLGTPERAAGAKAYLKSDLEFWGVTTPDLRRAVRGWLQERPAFGRAELRRLSSDLWDRPVHEMRSFALELLLARGDLLESADLDLVESFLRRSRSWAYVDALAIHVVGPLIERDPRLKARLDRWVRDGDFWIRRSALLALLLPLRRGGGDWSRFVRYADTLLGETEFFIRKAIGWVLREVSKKRPDRVREFLDARRGRISGVTRREAVKYLPSR